MTRYEQQNNFVYPFFSDIRKIWGKGRFIREENGRTYFTVIETNGWRGRVNEEYSWPTRYCTRKQRRVGDKA